MGKAQLIVATGNLGKLKEIKEICADLPVEITSLKDHWDPVPDIPETGSTFEANARIKAEWVHDKSGVWTLADDSGLQVDALGGAPGVTSARYSGENATDQSNRDKLVGELSDVPAEKRTARFRCCMVLLGPGGAEHVANGTCEGTIADSPSGDGGFGYDPLFVPDGHSETFAELSSEKKHALSHRGNALAALRKVLQDVFA